VRALLALASLSALVAAGAGCDDPNTRLPGTWYAWEARTGCELRGCVGTDALLRDGALTLTFVEPLCGDWPEAEPGDRVTMRPRWAAWEKGSGRIIGRR